MPGAQAARRTTKTEGVSDQVRDIGMRWLEAGQSYLQGWQQFAQRSAAGTAAGEPPLKFGEEMLNAWQGTWTGAASAGEGATRQFADLICSLASAGTGSRADRGVARTAGGANRISAARTRAASSVDQGANRRADHARRTGSRAQSQAERRRCRRLSRALQLMGGVRRESVRASGAQRVVLQIAGATRQRRHSSTRSSTGGDRARLETITICRRAPS